MRLPTQLKPWFVRAPSPCWLGNRHRNGVDDDSEIINQTTSRCDAWIRRPKDTSRLRNQKRKQNRCRLRNHQRDFLHRWCLVSSARTVPVDSVIVTENWVADDLEIITETLSTAEAWIGLRTQSQVTRKSSLTMSLSQLKNHHQNCFPSWLLVSSERTVPIDSVIITENGVADDS
jgi:hypothetical protein